MAKALTISRRYQGGLAKFRDLEAESAQELLVALKDAPSTVSSYSLSSAVAAKVDTIAATDVEEIVPSLLHVHSVRDISALPVSDLAEGIARGMEEASSNGIRSSPQQHDSFRARLVEVLGIDQLRVIARAAGLLFENEHSATQTRILTDIRPIFEQESPQAPPVGAVVVHTLKISYWADNEERSFFVALDTNDVRELSEQLERANLKADSLRSVLEAAQVPYVDSE
jgi:hypothetical protein